MQRIRSALSRGAAADHSHGRRPWVSIPSRLIALCKYNHGLSAVVRICRRSAAKTWNAALHASNRTKDRTYQHRMMDFNNDPTTHLSDVKNLFAEAIARVK